jgi:DNA-binding MarR family transcriptional regulator
MPTPRTVLTGPFEMTPAHLLTFSANSEDFISWARTHSDVLMAVIRALKERHQEKHSPTLQEIAKALGITPQAAHKRVQVAKRRGLISVIPRKHRGIILL